MATHHDLSWLVQSLHSTPSRGPDRMFPVETVRRCFLRTRRVNAASILEMSAGDADDALEALDGDNAWPPWLAYTMAARSILATPRLPRPDRSRQAYESSSPCGAACGSPVLRAITLRERVRPPVVDEIRLRRVPGFPSVLAEASDYDPGGPEGQTREDAMSCDGSRARCIPAYRRSHTGARLLRRRTLRCWRSAPSTGARAGR